MNPDDVRASIPEYLLGSLEPADAERVEAELASSAALRREAEAWQRVLFSLPESLDPEPLDAGAWERLRAVTFGSDAAHDAEARRDTQEEVRLPTEATADRVGTETARPRRWLRAPWSGVLLAASLVLVLAVGAWGWDATRDAVRLADEQRIIAYWMRSPELQIVALTGLGPGAVAPGAERPEVAPGVVCVLPDGRAMVLQPYAAPPGSRYVVYGVRDGQRVQLAQGHQRLLLFDGKDIDRIELKLEGRREAVVAEARL